MLGSLAHSYVQYGPKVTQEQPHHGEMKRPTLSLTVPSTQSQTIQIGGGPGMTPIIMAVLMGGLGGPVLAWAVRTPGSMKAYEVRRQRLLPAREETWTRISSGRTKRSPITHCCSARSSWLSDFLLERLLRLSTQAASKLAGDQHHRPKIYNNLKGKVARETGLEPATSGVTGRRSNQLSYSRSGKLNSFAQRGVDVPSPPCEVKRSKPPFLKKFQRPVGNSKKRGARGRDTATRGAKSLPILIINAASNPCSHSLKGEP